MDRKLAQDCARPTKLPEGSLTQADIEKYWGRDRSNLLICGARHKGVVNYYARRDALLMDKGVQR